MDIKLLAKTLGRLPAQAVKVHLSPGERNPIEGKKDFCKSAQAAGRNNEDCRANFSGKMGAEKERNEKARKARELTECLTPFTTSQLRKYVLKNNPRFVLDEQTEDPFNHLCQYFANDPAFEKSGYSLSKGILLTGPVGVGKTELLRIFSKNKRQCFQMISVYDIETACQKNGVEFYRTYSGMVPGWGNSPEYFYQKSVGWAFDDIGRESMVFDFGNKPDVVSKIIQTRYLHKNSISFNNLHLTTNLTPEEIESRYDYAVKSRMREMFNYVVMDGVDRS